MSEKRKREVDVSSPINGLPYECLFVIFAFAAPRDTLRIILRLVCKSWNEIAKPNSENRYAWPDVVPTLLSSVDLLKFRPDKPFPLGVLCDAVQEGIVGWCEYVEGFVPPYEDVPTNELLCFAAANGQEETCHWALMRGAHDLAKMMCAAALGGKKNTCELARKRAQVTSGGLDTVTDIGVIRCAALGGSVELCETLMGWVKGGDEKGRYSAIMLSGRIGGHEDVALFAIGKMSGVFGRAHYNVTPREYAKILMEHDLIFTELLTQKLYLDIIHDSQSIVTKMHRDDMLCYAVQNENCVLCECAIKEGAGNLRKVLEMSSGNIEILEFIQEEMKKRYLTSRAEEPSKL